MRTHIDEIIFADINLCTHKYSRSSMFLNAFGWMYVNSWLRVKDIHFMLDPSKLYSSILLILFELRSRTWSRVKFSGFVPRFSILFFDRVMLAVDSLLRFPNRGHVCRLHPIINLRDSKRLVAIYSVSGLFHRFKLETYTSSMSMSCIESRAFTVQSLVGLLTRGNSGNGKVYLQSKFQSFGAFSINLFHSDKQLVKR